MFCDKTHINQLTALLKGHGFQDIVVCPGSRNGILVHDFDAAQFRLHPVTDERSAAFVALGLCLSTRHAVAVCVTSGSALLNTLPAVAEASFRQIPILIISADRPQQWIGQLDGQTLPQANALLPYAQSYNIAEAHTPEEEHWNLLRMNQAILALRQHGGQPVHLNIPITEPLFSFHTATLPDVPVVHEERQDTPCPFSDALLQRISAARFPVMVIGQYEKGTLEGLEKIERQGSLLILPELISGQQGSWRTTALEHLLPEFDFTPDLVLHIGGNLVNKQLKLHLRRLSDCNVIRIEPTEELPDTFGHLHTVVRTSPENAIRQLADTLTNENREVKKYQEKLDSYRALGNHYAATSFSDLGIMQLLSQHLPEDVALQVGNSSVIRNAAYYFSSSTNHLFCNRGTNGIEGSLSAAVGYALGSQQLTVSLIGDLSFFYDQNALWNKQLPGNLRILLFNNGGGQIFYHLPGLDQTPALSPYIAAAHHTQAQGLAESYGLSYLKACNYKEVQLALPQLLDPTSQRPVLLEVFTQTENNEKELKSIKQYYKTK